MEKEAFFKLSYGLYIITTKYEEHFADSVAGDERLHILPVWHRQTQGETRRMAHSRKDAAHVYMAFGRRRCACRHARFPS